MPGRRAARTVRLRYVSDESLAGITRHGALKQFSYRKPSGARVTDAATLKRIARLAIPPAWRDVWIAPVPAGSARRQ